MEISLCLDPLAPPPGCCTSDANVRVVACPDCPHVLLGEVVVNAAKSGSWLLCNGVEVGGTGPPTEDGTADAGDGENSGDGDGTVSFESSSLPTPGGENSAVISPKLVDDSSRAGLPALTGVPSAVGVKDMVPCFTSCSTGLPK